jgi:calcineurin-like phosphoesterase family protein
MIHFTSDLHLGDAGIFKHQPERLALFGNNVDAMDTAIIDGINASVNAGDELWILGDFSWKASKQGHYRHRLKARSIHVVTGNHDSSSLRNHVSSMNDMVYRKFGRQKFHMTHYPIVSWRAREHGTIHLYGHCHGTMESTLNDLWPARRAQDVGIDYAYRIFGDCRPFSMDYIMEKFPLMETENE